MISLLTKEGDLAQHFSWKDKNTMHKESEQERSKFSFAKTTVSLQWPASEVNVPNLLFHSLP